jgi:hypothetical protein
MNWRNVIGNLLMRVGDSLPEPATQVYTDPFNYTLASLLQDSRRAPAALQAAVQQEFPSVNPTDYAALSQQINAAYTLAADLASEVNKQQITQDTARERLQQAYPQMAPANLGSLLLQNLIGTR